MRWLFETDANIVRNLESDGDQSVVERVEVEGAVRLPLADPWHWGAILTAQEDDAGGVQSRVLAGANIGRSTTGPWGKFVLEAGAAITYEDVQSATSQSFAEAWFQSTVRWNFTETAMLVEKLGIFGRISDTSDYRLDSETDLMLHLSKKLSAKMGVEIKWDHEPSADFDELDISTHMAIVFSWGGSGGSSQRSPD